MKNLLMLFCAVGLIVTTSCNQSKISTKDLKNTEDSLSYYMAVSFGEGVKQQIKASKDSTKFNAAELLKGAKLVLNTDTNNISFENGLMIGLQLRQMMAGAKFQLGTELNKDIIIKALEEAVNSKKDIVSQAECQARINSIIGKLQQEKVNKEISKNEAEGKAFLDKKMKGDRSIKLTKSGLAYKVIKEGKGAKLTDNDQANIIYTGTFTNGKKFDSSNGKAVNLGVNQVVPGFSEALKMMAPGAHYIVYIPGKLAYGPNGQPYAGIGPNQMLVFDIQLVAADESKKTNEKPATVEKVEKTNEQPAKVEKTNEQPAKVEKETK